MNKVFISKVIEYLVVLNTSLFISTGRLNRLKFCFNNVMHGIENSHEIACWFLESLILCKGTEFLINTLSPIRNLVVDNVDSLETFTKLLVLFKYRTELLVHHNNIAVLLNNWCIFAFISIVWWIKSKLMELSAELLVWLFEVINLGLWFRDSLKKGGVGLFTGQEFTDHFLNISNLSCSLNVFECLINLSAVTHLFFHTFAHVSVPQFLCVEVFTHF